MTVAVLNAMLRLLLEDRLPDWVEPRWFASSEKAAAQAQQPPARVVPVETAQAAKKTVPVRLEALGTVTPIASVANSFCWCQGRQWQWKKASAPRRSAYCNCFWPNCRSSRQSSWRRKSAVKRKMPCMTWHYS